MRAISANRRAVREALAHEGWRFALVGSVEELKRHQESCRTLSLPVGNESANRSRTIREELLARLPWEVRGQPFPRWMSYISKSARKRLQPNLPLAAEFCLVHGFIFLVGNVWAERQGDIWRTHRADGPAVVSEDHELYFFTSGAVGKYRKKPSWRSRLQNASSKKRTKLREKCSSSGWA